MALLSIRRVGLATVLLLGWPAWLVLGSSRFQTRDLLISPLRGEDVGTALLVEFYNELPEAGEEDSRAAQVARLKALTTFEKKVSARYTEGTLERLLDAPDVRTRRAAVLALGLVGTMRSNQNLAVMLHDEDREIRLLAANGLWSLWFRADSEGNNQELQRVLRLNDPDKQLSGLNLLIQKAPTFAEAYNQRAILLYRRGEYQKSIGDCEKVIHLNPYHFGAMSGMAQCYMKLRKPKPALKAFRNAYRVNPELEGVEETIRALEDVLGDDGKGK
ncbi:MAG: tetratricopeptide repeat protein [Planctomycetes bacterium]|nr:tetratricopeptide repeat protein [Planctomycetota bacterium]